MDPAEEISTKGTYAVVSPDCHGREEWPQREMQEESAVTTALWERTNKSGCHGVRFPPHSILSSGLPASGPITGSLLLHMYSGQQNRFNVYVFSIVKLITF